MRHYGKRNVIDGLAACVGTYDSEIVRIIRNTVAAGKKEYTNVGSRLRAELHKYCSVAKVL